MSIRDVIPSAVLALTVFLLAGCGGDDQAHTRELSRYTPEVLVEETLTRYKAAVKTAKSGKGKADVKTAKGAGKGKAAGASADDDKLTAAEAKYGSEVRSRDTAGPTNVVPIVDISEGVVRKVPLIEGLPANLVYIKLDEAIDRDPELTSQEKDALKDGIAEARKKGPTTKE